MDEDFLFAMLNEDIHENLEAEENNDDDSDNSEDE